MTCFDFQGIHDATWFPTGGASTPIDLQSVSVEESDSLVGFKNNNNIRIKSFTISASNTSGSIVSKNLKQGLTIVNGGISGVLVFKSTDICLNGSGETLTVTIEEVVFENKSTPFQTESGSAVSQNFQASSGSNDGETNPITYAFA
jgi:hypothetical protein